MHIYCTPGSCRQAADWYQQIANALRAAILTRKLQPGEKLPSGTELAKRYGVARMTVQQAIRLLRDENLIVSRQGSGAYVRERTERPVGLRPHLERAFEDARGIMERHTAELGLVDEVSAQIRVNPAVPMFKLYVLIEREAFLGYDPVQEHTADLGGETPRYGT